MSWALMGLLAEAGVQVQHFHARACFSRINGAPTATGLSSRHLDSWLMSKDLNQGTFWRGCRQCDLGLIEGCFDSADHCDARGGPLGQLCDWLDVPRLGVLDVAGLDHGCCPEAPAPLDGVLLDGVTDARQYARLQTSIEALWGVPVLGALERLSELREKIEATPRGAAPAAEHCRALTASFARYASAERLLRLAARSDYAFHDDKGECEATIDEPPRRVRRPFTVALAFDEAFNCYFPDTLDLLEARGAHVVDFSPLSDETLPDGADLIYFGCGHPERYADALGDNHCMVAAIHEHVCAGRKIYAEGGGLAYLCQRIDQADGRQSPMIGVLPAVARLSEQSLPPEPVEATLARRTWLGPEGRRVRGYLNRNWAFDAVGPLCGCLAEADRRCDLVQRGMTLGSRVHLNFVAQPEAVEELLRDATVGAAAFDD